MKDKPWFATYATKEGHKSYECKVNYGGGAKKKEKKQTSKLSNTYTNKVDKKASTPYLLKKKKNDKVVAIKVNKQANNGVKRFWVPKEILTQSGPTKDCSPTTTQQSGETHLHPCNASYGAIRILAW